MLKKIKLKSRLLLRYIFSYFTIFFIPFIIMSIVLYNHSVVNFQKEIEASKVSKLNQSEQLITERMVELEHLASRIAYDSQLTPYMIQYKAKSGEAIEELKKYKTNSSILDELFIYFYDQPIIYSSSGVYSVDTWTQLYDFQNYSKKELLLDLEIKSSVLLPVIEGKTNERMIATSQSIIPNNPHPHGTIVYYIKESVIMDILKNIVDDYNGNAYILDPEYNIISSFESESDFDLTKMDLTSLNSDYATHIKQNGKEYFVATKESSYKNWLFLTVMNTDQFADRIIHKKVFVLSILTSVFLFGIILAFIFASRQYSPIVNLFQLTKRTSEENTTENFIKENEFKSIEKTITDIVESQKTLSATIDLQKPYVKEQLLTKLLKGGWKTDKEINKIFNEMEIYMYDTIYFVIILNLILEDEAKMEDIENITDHLSTISLQQKTIHAVDLLEKDRIALIISSQKTPSDPLEYSHEIALKIQDKIDDINDWETSLGIGNIYQDKSFINRSYIEALAAIDYQVAHSEDSIIHFEDIHKFTTKHIGFPEEEQMKLKQSIHQGDKTVAIETLQDIFIDLKNKEISVDELKCICFDLINTLIKTISELDLINDMDQLTSLIHFKSLKQLEEEAKEIVINVCKQVEEKRESHHELLRKDILDYIHEHYKKYDLSLERLADHLELSAPYVSRFIKEQLGVTFTQYVFNLRLEEVKRNLIETDKLIKDIIAEVGYQDVSNFTRQFRKIEGVTPGQYRKMNKN